MSAFDDAVDALFADENLKTAAVYRAGGSGSPLDVTVLFSRPQRAPGFGEITAVVRDYKARVRLSEVATPKKGDTLTIATVLYRVERVLADNNNITVEMILSVPE